MIDKSVFLWISECGGFDKESADRMYKLATNKSKKANLRPLRDQDSSKPSAMITAGFRIGFLNHE